MILTSQQEQQFQLGLQAVELGVISSECLLKSLSLWLTSENASLVDIVISQSDLRADSRATLERMFADSLRTAQPSPLASARQAETRTEDFQLGERQLDILQKLLNDKSQQPTSDVVAEEEQGTITYTGPMHASDRLKLEELVERARSVELLRFQVGELLGKGGLGVVYRGTDLQFNRDVAIKKIAPKKSKDILSREKFYLEAEVTGQLEHPGIVPVYALGTDDGQEPYYAMRLIPGNNLLNAIEQFHSLYASQPGCFDSLEFRDLLNRFVDVCNAIEYAHSRCVLHRDLKPSNIMVGTHGETLVVDWGLAKVIPKNKIPSGETASPVSAPSAVQVLSAIDMSIDGMIAGTPQFAAPEQLAGQISQLGPAADIYSLGAVLYQLLCGQPPLGAVANPREALTLLRDKKLKPTREILPTVPKPLDAICRKCMMLEVEDRYPSAQELAADVQRWLADMRVLAYRDEPFSERLGRWIRHHRSWTVSVASSLLIVSVITIVAALLINRARLGEQVARKSAVEFKTDAVARYRVAKSAIDTLVERADKLVNVPGTQDLQFSILQEAASRYQALSQSQSLDPELEIERVRALVRLADVQLLQGQTQAAYETYMQAIDQLNRSRGEAAAVEPPLHPTSIETNQAIELGRTWTRYGLAQATSYQFDKARASYRQALDIFERWRQFHPTHPNLAGNWAIALMQLGELELESGKPTKSVELLKQSTSLFEEALTTREDAMRSLFALKEINAHEVLGRALRKTGQHALAKAELAAALDACSNLLSSDPANRVYRERQFSLLVSIAESNRTQGDWKLALENLREARSIIEHLVGEASDSLDYGQLLTTRTLSEGLILLESGQYADARTVLETAVHQSEMLADAFPGLERSKLRAAAYSAIGETLLAIPAASAPASDAAQQWLEAALKTLEPFLSAADTPPDRVDWLTKLIHARYRSHLARYLAKTNQTDRARQEFSQAISVMKDGISRQMSVLQAKADLAHTLWHSGDFEFAQGNREVALAQFEQAIQLWQELIRDDYTPLHQYYLAKNLFECPDESLRDQQQAKKLAQACAAAVPDNERFAELSQR